MVIESLLMGIVKFSKKLQRARWRHTINIEILRLHLTTQFVYGIVNELDLLK